MVITCGERNKSSTFIPQAASTVPFFAVECRALREALAEQPSAGGSDGIGNKVPQGGSSGVSSARARADALRIKSLEQKNKEKVDQVGKTFKACTK